MYTTPTQRWQALTARDPSASTAFIYAVLTTRIFCRPNCPSRLARRANIVYFATAAEASAAGFRACKRCRPAAAEEAEETRQEVMVRRAMARIAREKGIVRLEELAREAGASRWHFQRVFKKLVGCTPREWALGLAQQRRERGEAGRMEEGALDALVQSDVEDAEVVTPAWQLNQEFRDGWGSCDFAKAINAAEEVEVDWESWLAQLASEEVEINAN